MYRPTLDNPLTVDNTPSTARIVTSQCYDGKDRYIVHILHYIPERRCKSIDVIEDVIPIYNINLKVRVDGSPSMLSAPDERSRFVYNNGYVEFAVEVNGYQTVVIE